MTTPLPNSHMPTSSDATIIPTASQHLPPQRHFDERCKPARSVYFHDGWQPGCANFTWSPSNGIVFAKHADVESSSVSVLGEPSRVRQRNVANDLNRFPSVRSPTITSRLETAVTPEPVQSNIDLSRKRDDLIRRLTGKLNLHDIEMDRKRGPADGRKACGDGDYIFSAQSLFSDNYKEDVHIRPEQMTSSSRASFKPTECQPHDVATSLLIKFDGIEISSARGPGASEITAHLELQRREESKLQQRFDERRNSSLFKENPEYRGSPNQVNLAQGLRLTPTGSKQAQIPYWVNSSHKDQVNSGSSGQEHDSTTDETSPSEWSPETLHTGENNSAKFRISPSDYRNAMKASKNSTAAYWTYKLYKDSAGETPLIYYCQKFEQAQEQAKKFLHEPILGFDLEWEPNTKAKTIKQNVSLIQIAAEDKIGLFHIARFVGDKTEDLMPPALREILESDKIVKAGVNVANDSTRLAKWLGVNMKGLFELSHLYKVVKYSHSNRSAIDKKPLKLAEQVQQALLLPMKKDDVRVSNWSKRLNSQQTEYSASDAYAGYQLYRTLEAERKEMVPMPPRPAFWEAQQPLVLGDGTVLMRRAKKTTITVRDTTAEQEEGEEAEEEFFDAVQVLDPCDLGEANPDASGIELPRPKLPTLGKTSHLTSEENTPRNSSFEQQNETKSTACTPGQDPLSSHELARADGWAARYLSSLPEGKAKCRAGALRAWHLWYEQGFDLKVIAALARNPPLSQITVASYILEAVKQENLPFHAHKIKQAFDLIPTSVSHKYRNLLERVNAPS